MAVSFCVIGGLLVFFTILYSLSFYMAGSQTYDKATGQIYGIQMHGTLYVTARLAIIYYAGNIIGGVLILIGIIISCIEARSE